MWKTGPRKNEIEKTSLAKNTISVVINGMVNKGIVERNINPRNRRQTIVSLAEYAKSLQEKYEAVSQQRNTLFYHGFPNIKAMFAPRKYRWQLLLFFD